uniref:Cadherin domain-containing protein n=1 Tax=Oreochromis niloticus TaxID=8128 RepID=A0A669BBX4_ORENI
MKEGSVVANLATDLGLDVKTLNQRKMRLDIIANKKYLDLNKETGELYVVEKIDREHICPTKSLASCYLKLESFYTIRVMENNAPGALLSSLTAFDPDLHENQYLVYFIIEKEIANTSMSMLFSINPENGNLYALKTFDYEIEKEFLFHIEARDSGSPPLKNPLRIFNIELEILDINDNAPQFRRDAIHLDISESTPTGERFSLSNAVDPDVGSNSVKTYHLSESEQFTIEVQTGRDGSKFADLILKQTLDREKQAVHNLILTARDSGSPPLSSNVTIHIIIVDQNDNAPVIVSPWRAHGSVVEEKIPRSTDKGSLVAKVIALDTDSVHNSRITYQFLQVTDATLFSLDQYNGEIRTMRMFSYRDPLTCRFHCYIFEAIGCNNLHA